MRSLRRIQLDSTVLIGSVLILITAATLDGLILATALLRLTPARALRTE
jgi:hypothetical protein